MEKTGKVPRKEAEDLGQLGALKGSATGSPHSKAYGASNSGLAQDTSRGHSAHPGGGSRGLALDTSRGIRRTREGVPGAPAALARGPFQGLPLHPKGGPGSSPPGRTRQAVLCPRLAVPPVKARPRGFPMKTDLTPLCCPIRTTL